MIAPAETTPTDVEQTPRINIQSKPAFRVLSFALRRFLAIAMTIFVGIFIIVVLANHNGGIDKIIRSEINQQVAVLGQNPYFHGNTQVEAEKMATARGLTLSFWPKYIRYTWQALTLDFGDALDRKNFNVWINTPKGVTQTLVIREIIFAKLPYTILLSGVSYLLLALLGIPLALYLSRNEGNWLDRLVGILTPLSSVPSWVMGVLLVLVFSAELKWFPAGKIFDNMPPSTTLGVIGAVAYHLVLPVTAIVLSLIFQLVYGWRSYLLIYAQEDYVMLAQAKGAKQKTINQRYILRPALPYLVTNLALTLVGFWQMICALEYFFQWPGIGKLFIDALPNFRSESMYSGEMGIVIGIIVIFAYLLGATVFVLDFFYLIVDPRLRLSSQEKSSLLTFDKPSKSWIKKLFSRSNSTPAAAASSAPRRKPIRLATLNKALTSSIAHFRENWAEITHSAQKLLRDIYRVPAARVGLGLAAFLVIAAILVMIFIPYNPVGKNWTQSNLTGNPTVAKFAQPKWVNWFRKNKLPETLIFNTVEGTALKEVTTDAAGNPHLHLEFPFDYASTDFPSELALYLSPEYSSKNPFMAVTWTTPDGRQFKLKNTALTHGMNYVFAGNIPVSQILRDSPNLNQWFTTTEVKQNPDYYLLFTNPNAKKLSALPGRYSLDLDITFFEPQGNLDAEWVVFGKVEGWAGTDYLRRDLLIPLLWGLPLALFIGVFGALFTSLISLILAAASAWLGGWVDFVVQHATEANLILPVLAVGVLLYSYYNLSLWLIIGIIILANVLGSSTKVMRAAFLQEKQAGYVEAAKSYGASDWRIIRHYLVPRIMPVIIPQIVMLIPGFIFLEATLAIFTIYDTRYPTWGRIIYSALHNGALYGSQFWVLEPITLMLLTGLAFVLISFGLNRVLAPHLQSD